MSKERIFVLCAHSDDQVVGPGGTLAKYAKEGKEVYTIVFSYGESSHPHLKDDLVIKMRVKESQMANKVIGGRKVFFLGLKEGRFLEDASNRSIKDNLVTLIHKYRPSKIFVHSPDDPHPDHRACHKIVVDVLASLNYKPEVYAFDVWNLWNIKTDRPKLYVDITKTFYQKIAALECFPSQKIQMQIPLTWSVYLRAMIHGFKAGCKYAERFYRIQ